MTDHDTPRDDPWPGSEPREKPDWIIHPRTLLLIVVVIGVVWFLVANVL